MDRELIARIREGDGEALRELIGLYQHRVFALVYGILRDSHAVEDVAQEVFLKVYSRIHLFDDRSRFYTWLYRVAVNTAKDHVKRMRRRPAIALDDAVEVADDGPEPGSGAATAELRRQVRAAIAALPPRYREVLTLREIEGLTYGEIADILRLSVGTVESRLYRARERLKRRLRSHVL